MTHVLIATGQLLTKYWVSCLPHCSQLLSQEQKERQKPQRAQVPLLSSSSWTVLTQGFFAQQKLIQALLVA